MHSHSIKYVLIILLFFCNSNSLFPRDIEDIKQSGKIYIGFDPADIGTINQDLAQEFGRFMDLEVIEVIVEWDKLFQKNGKKPDNLEVDPNIKYTPDAFDEVDIYCSTISPLEWRKKLFDFAETLISTEVLIIRKDMDNKPTGLNSLKGLEIAIMKNTSFETHLNELNSRIGGGIQIAPINDVKDVKKLLIEKKVDGIVLDANDALIFNKENQSQFELLFPISDISKSVWGIEKGNKLKENLNEFFIAIEKNGILDHLFETRYDLSYSQFKESIIPRIPFQKYQRDLNEIIKSKKIVFGFRERDFVFHKNGEKQFMHVLAEKYAEYLGVDFEYVIIDNFNTYWQAADGQVYRDSIYTPEIFNYFDLAVDIFSDLEWRRSKVDFAPAFFSDYAILAKPETRISSISDLHNYEGVTVKNTSYHDVFTQNKIHNIQFIESTNELINYVRNDSADYTMILNSFLYPDLESKITLGSESVNWACRKDQPQLKKSLLGFIQKSENNGLLKALNSIAKGESLTNLEEFLNNYYQKKQPGEIPKITINSTNGLPQEDIKYIFQDSIGYIWFGTLSGLLRYDGTNIKHWTTNDGIISNTINSINEINHQIFVATDIGISIIYDSQITNISFKEPISRINEDALKNIFILGKENIYKYDTGNIEKITSLGSKDIPNGIKNLLLDQFGNNYIFHTDQSLYSYDIQKDKLNKLFDYNRIYSIFIDSENYLWYSTNSGIFRSRVSDLQKDKMPRKLNEDLNIPMTPIFDISQGKTSSVWFKNSSHLYEVNSINQKATVYSTNTDLINNIILSYYEDQDGILWVGYSGGVQKIIGNKNIRLLFPELINTSILSKVQDIQNNIWFSTNFNIYVFDVRKNELININAKAKLEKSGGIVLNNNEQQNIIVISKKYIYEISPLNYKIKSKTIHKLGDVSSAIYLGNGNLIINSNSQFLYLFEKSNNNKYALSKKFESNISNLVEFNERIFGIDKSNLYQYDHTDFEMANSFSKNINCISEIDDKIWIGGNGELHILNNDSLTTIKVENDLIIKALTPSQNKNYFWMGTNKGVHYVSIHDYKTKFMLSQNDGLSGNEIIKNGLLIDNSGLLWISTYHGLANFRYNKNSKLNISPNSFIDEIYINDKLTDISKLSHLNYNQNNIRFRISGITYSNDQSIIYEHYLRHNKARLSHFFTKSESNIINYNNLPAGEYTFVYRVILNNQVVSYSNSISFTITPPIWEKLWFQLAGFLVLIAIVYLIYRLNIRRIQKQKSVLEHLVKERTKDLEVAGKKIESQMQVVQDQKEQITQSIEYAERIQKSLLPQDQSFKNLKDYFVLFKPKDIVSGDFYWTTETNNHLLIAAVDCTGHGVPGAFMSLLGISFLKEIVNRTQSTIPSIILNELRNTVIKTLHQDQNDGFSKDGMDMSLISINKENHSLMFSGANNPVYIQRNQKFNIPLADKFKLHNENLLEIKGDNMPIGIYDKMESFSTREIQLQEFDKIFLFSDGYIDQFGGPNSKKIKSKTFREMINSCNQNELSSYKKKLETFFIDWKGTEDQIDDVTVIGIQI